VRVLNAEIDGLGPTNLAMQKRYKQSIFFNLPISRKASSSAARRGNTVRGPSKATGMPDGDGVEWFIIPTSFHRACSDLQGKTRPASESLFHRRFCLRTSQRSPATGPIREKENDPGHGGPSYRRATNLCRNLPAGKRPSQEKQPTLT